ncbi:MAG: hypothetical protein ACR5LF_11490 [Symbiopectobacterium sp.]
MAKVDVRCPFYEQTASVKNTVMAKVAISVTIEYLTPYLLTTVMIFRHTTE